MCTAIWRCTYTVIEKWKMIYSNASKIMKNLLHIDGGRKHKHILEWHNRVTRCNSAWKLWHEKSAAAKLIAFKSWVDKTGACMDRRRRVAALLRRRFSHQLSSFLELWTHVHEYKKRRMKTHTVQEARVCSKVKRASLWWVLTHWSLHTSQV